MNQFTDRIIRAAKLDVNLYEEVEADESSLGQAMGVVVLSSLAAGIGGIGGGMNSIIGGIVAALLSWFVWAYITYFIGTRLLPESQTSATMGELLRTIGFASSPGLLRIFGFIPVVGIIINLIVAIWMLVAMIVAVRQALDYTSTGRAVCVCLVGWVALLAVSYLLFGLIGGGGVA